MPTSATQPSTETKPHPTDDRAELVPIFEVTRIAGDGGWVKEPPYVLITISGGVADVAVNASKVGVDILDYDDLKESIMDQQQLILSDEELAFIRAHDDDVFIAEVEALLPSTDEDDDDLTREEMEEHDDTPSLQDQGKELGSYGS